MITMEGWSKIMYMNMNAIGDYVCLYFIALIVIGSFFLLNLILAVIMQSFNENDNREKNRIKDKQLHEIALKKAQLSKLEKENELMHQKWKKIYKRSKSIDVQNTTEKTFPQLILRRSLEHEDEEEEEDSDRFLSPHRHGNHNKKMISSSCSDNGDKLDNGKESMKGDLQKINKNQRSFENDIKKRKQDLEKNLGEIYDENNEVVIEEFENESIQNEPKNMNCGRRILLTIVVSKYFNHFINFSIVLNTIVLAMDRYPINSTELRILESINIGFYCIFFLEMVMKMIGMGVKGYMRDKFNIFDAIIVVLSSIDLIISLTTFNTQTEGNNSISAFRAFRLLRIFKLVKSWK